MEFVEKPTRKSFVDIEGMIFGELKIIGYLGPKGSQQRWLAECSCGNTVNVDGTSVRANLTKSCGCLRKKNGGKIPLLKEEAEELCVGFELIEYKGMKHPATFKCKDCGKFGETPLANNLRSYICECKGNTSQQKREDAFRDKGFQLLSTEGQIHTILCMSCKTESYYSGALEYIDICKCKLDVSSDKPAAIYCLHNNTDDYIKVGKSIRPRKRLGDINSDRIENNMEPLDIYKIIWVVSESAAYHLESLYHRKHIGHRLYLEDWTGSTETFELGVESFDTFINEHKILIDKLKTEEPPKYTLKYRPYYDSYEIDGIWYPNKRSIRNRLKISAEAIDRYLSGKQTMEEILNPTQYCYDGTCSPSLQELCLKLKISINALYNRKQKGMTTDDAIYDLLNNPPSERISSVIVDGNKMSLKAMWEIFGLKNKTANNTFLKFNKDVYAVLNKYGIKTNKTIELIRMFDNNDNN